MRIMLTVVDAADVEHDLVLHADRATPLSAVAKLFAAELDDAPSEDTVAPLLYVGDTPLSGALDLAASPLRDGCRIGLGRPLASGSPDLPAVLPDDAGATLPLEPADDGTGLIFHRPPRMTWPAPGDKAFAFEAPSRVPLMQWGWYLPRRLFEEPLAVLLLAVLPLAVLLLVAGLIWAFALHYLALAALCAAGILGLALAIGLRISRENKQRVAMAWQRVHDDRVSWNLLNPGPDAVSGIASDPGGRLWERRRADPDYLLLRVGTESMPSHLEPSLPIPDTPVTVSLAERGVLGVAGVDDWRRAVARWLVAQIATLHSPGDVRICLLTGPDQQAEWEWVRWLPHCRPLEGQGPIALIGTDAATVSWRITELLSVIASRQRTDVASRTSIVVVFDDWPRLHSHKDALRILRKGPQAGVFAICLGASTGLLPPECVTIITAEQEQLVIRQPGQAEIANPARADLATPAWCERLARGMAPIRDADAEREPSLPASSRLLDVLRLGQATPQAIVDRWKARGSSTAAVIGESYDGPFSINLRRDGPHGLIAGTTGSGKSGLLHTIVASLAVANRPDAMTFLLIDYKGGAAFSDCADLPHTVGVIVDLDPYLAERALTSLSAELRRREYLLAAVGTKDIEDYSILRSQQPGLPSLPRLVIAVDEFAAIASYIPEFVAGLVNIAQRGRSLGIHLLLATQRPSGAISADIRSNTNLRIALRLLDPAESADIIDVGDAAFIPAFLPGRAYVRVWDSDLVPVQTSWVSMRSLRPASSATPRLTPVGWASLGRAEPLPSADASEQASTDLTTLAAAIRQANELLRIPPPHPPWLPDLPGAVLLSELRTSVPEASSDARFLPIPYGLEDLPAEQAQRAAVIDFASFSHLLAVGEPRTGRSQLLRTIAGSIAATHSSADVHLYGIDCGSGYLRSIGLLPHCGAVVTAEQAELANRLIRRLGQELRRRQELLAESRFADIGEQRQGKPPTTPNRRLPHIVVLLDRWEEFTKTLGDLRFGTLTDTIMSILYEGASVGMHMIITGGRSVLGGRMAAMAGDVLAFRLPDQGDYMLIGLRYGDIPQAIPAGRALRSGSRTQVQVALLDGEPTAAGQEAALRSLAEVARARDAGVELAQRPFRVEVALATGDRFHVGDAHGRPVGREDVLAWLRARHAVGDCVAMLGPRRAGKTWILGELRRRLAEDGLTHVRDVTVQLPSSRVETPDEFARLLDRSARTSRSPAERLLDEASSRARKPDRLAFLLDEVGRLVKYSPAAVSWLRDLGQAGAWLVYTGTENDWRLVVRWALTAPGSSFGNDVNARLLGPLDERDAVTFLVGTAANLQVDVSVETADRIVAIVGSWPFYLQVAGDAIVRAAQAGDMRPLRDHGALRQLIESRLLDEWTHHFQSRWAEIGSAGRAALLRDPGQAPDDLTPAQRNDLRDVGLLRSGDGWLDDRPLFEWVARNATALRDGERRP